MSFKITNKKESIRDGLGRAVAEMDLDPDIVVVVADLGKSIGLDTFSDNTRYIECGIAEANMVTVATGIALSGKKAICGSFASFIPNRAYDQIRTSVCLENANVKLIGGHAGFSWGADGAQVQSFEDVALMRILPNMKVYVPCCASEAEIMAKLMMNEYGPTYLRVEREGTVDFEISDYELGKAHVIREGKDVTILGMGSIVSEAYIAAEKLSSELGIEAEVINVSCIKPLDKETILESVKKTGKVLVVEEHQKAGGLYSLISELFASELPTKVYSISMNDSFGESARCSKELRDKYGLSSDNIFNIVSKI